MLYKRLQFTSGNDNEKDKIRDDISWDSTCYVHCLQHFASVYTIVLNYVIYIKHK